ncbi:MAG: UvrB/UvrC motif-containing protein [Firmicutes bacterium]|nr:UvrB/UvrC motif-containing protein [Bacillota bacterium]
MLCEECRKRPASIHMTRVVQDESGPRKTEVHLCRECAQEKQVQGSWGFDLAGPPFSIPALLAGFMDGTGYAPQVLKTTYTVKCPGCGMTFEHFRDTGRLGCGRCYQVFKDQLSTLLRRIHGKSRHAGKVPARAAGILTARRNLEQLREALGRKIEEEDFEAAAALRDQIRRLERELRAEREGDHAAEPGKEKRGDERAQDV